jgi:NADPH-dependent glutamate synthase beta subunit-like oxidoreductase/ferredoxin
LNTIRLTIDGQQIETTEGKSVLGAALDAGIYIPHLCHHGDLSPHGACRLCVVEIDGVDDILTSCTTLATSGMEVTTRSVKVDQIRRLAMELMMAAHPSDCTTCPKYLKCELQSLAQYLGITDSRLRRRPKEVAVNTGNPLILHDLTRCVLCGRCVRACHDLRGVEVLNYTKIDGETFIGTGADLLVDTGCRFCGACVEVCPTGALRDQEGIIDPGVPRKTALVPCKGTCPAGIDIPRYVRLIREKDYSAALAVIREKVPFPDVLGHICTQFCETACRRNELNESVAIRELKRFAAANGDQSWKKHVKQEQPTDKQVAVVGAGPAGLTAAYYLAKQGHGVTIFEALPFPGGMTRVGIPEYRLPRQVIANEIKEIENAGVDIKLNTRVNSLDELFAKGFHAVLISVGTHQGVKLPIPGGDLPGVLVNTSFLQDASLGKDMKLGKKVLILGGGNVAFDCARVACRLGADEVHLACLESRESMPASLEEVQQGEEEGIIVHPSHTFVRIVDEQGIVAGVECLDVESFGFDENKRPQIKVAEGSEHIIEADTVIFAVGQRPEIPESFGVDTGRGNTVQVDPETLATNREGVFAAGDAVSGTASVIAAIASGRKAAASMDQFLGGSGDIEEVLAPVIDPSAWLGRVENFATRKRCPVSVTPVDLRVDNFDEVDHCYSEDTAVKESDRCLQCDLRTQITVPRFWGDYSTR